MKLSALTVIFALAACAFGQGNQQKDLSDADGSSWQSTSETSKLGYISGYISAMEEATLTTAYLCGWQGRADSEPCTVTLKSLIWRMVELSSSAFESLANGLLVSGIVLTRAAVEVSAALWYLCAKVEAVVDSKAVGDVDDYLMKLAMGTATAWPETDSSADGLTMPRPVKISAFLKQAEKDIEGFSHQYGVLSEYTHPNWAGTVLLYSNTNKETAKTDFGENIRKADNAKAIGVVNLSVALKMFHERYNRISDLLPAFIGVCEGQFGETAASAPKLGR
jgi:hypothetical protein